MIAYKDMWGKQTDSYLHIMNERLMLMKDLIRPGGSIIVHIDMRVNSLIKLILDEIFGNKSFINEIAWCYGGGGAPRNYYPKKHDTLLWYAKGDNWTFNRQFRPYSEGTLERGLTQVKGDKYFLREEGAGLDDWWAGKEVQKILSPTAYENNKFPTQKPEGLLNRILFGHSNEGDLVADFFCGSGTTGAVAERLGRRWIMCDLGRFAIHTTRKRMIELQRQLYEGEKPYRAFDVYNLGRYERQWWHQERLMGADEEHRRIVLKFYRAEELSGKLSGVLHGRKGQALVHVDGIDSILELSELKAVAEAARSAGSKEVHCLAWEFEMELKRNAEAVEKEYGVKIKLVRIPREVMERNRRPGVDTVPFFEMATLEAKPVVKIEAGERIVDVELVNFLPSLTEVPGNELEALKERALRSGFDFIDFWAVDFDHHDGQPFQHHWQDYRLRKDRSLKLTSDCGYRYADSKAHVICVKVIDVFGCDTSVLVKAAGKGK